MLFNRYPKTTYTFQNDKTLEIVDIFRKVSLTQSTLNKEILYDTYFMTSGESPELVSYSVYGTPEYSHFIFLANQIVNPFYDWPADYHQKQTLLFNKYRGKSIFTYTLPEAEPNDILIKCSSDGQTIFDTCYSKVVYYNKELRAIVAYGGLNEFAENDYFLVTRIDSQGKLRQIPGSGVNTVQKVTNEYYMPYRFKLNNDTLISPYRIINRSNNTLTSYTANPLTTSTSVPSSYTNTETLYNTLLYMYIEGQTNILLSAGINIETILQNENKDVDKNYKVKIPKPNIINILNTLFEEGLNSPLNRSISINLKL
jgi:hypothetical protein